MLLQLSLPSKSIITLCNMEATLIVRQASSTLVPIGLYINHHFLFAYKNAHWTQFPARERAFYWNVFFLRLKFFLEIIASNISTTDMLHLKLTQRAKDELFLVLFPVAICWHLHFQQVCLKQINEKYDNHFVSLFHLLLLR